MGSAAWQEFEKRFQSIYLTRATLSLLSWDQQVWMPPGGAARRAEQLAYLESHEHSLLVDPAFVACLEEIERSGSASERAAVAFHLHRARRRKGVPPELVRELGEARGTAYEAWKAARERSSFDAFRGELERMVGLQRRLGDCLKRAGQSPYEALMEEFEPWIPAGAVDRLLGALRPGLVALVGKASRRGAEGAVPVTGLAQPLGRQREISELILELMGFDSRRGRLDVAPHPFCLGPGDDVRLTTRFTESDWTKSIFPTLHEGGHGLYEQGMLDANGVAALREAPSYGVHESQSRFWENFVGRSREFAELLVSRLAASGHPAAAVGADALYRHVNRVEAGYIRIEADEVTYNLHIVLRYELEKALISGELAVADLPAAWWARAKDLLGLEPAEDARGCLQDVHWSIGAFGYFPSYSLGNMIAAQLHAAISAELPLAETIRGGSMPRVRDWLREKVHAAGCSMSGWALTRASTGREPGAEALLAYLERKFG